MKTLNNYISESILDIDDNIKKTKEDLKKLVKDSYDFFNIYISSGNGSQVKLDKYLKINDISKYCDKLCKQYGNDKIGCITDKTACELVYILMHTQLLGFEQSLLVLLRSFLKKHYLIQMETDHRNKLFDLVYTIYPERDNNDPADEVDIHFVLKKNF
jgi:hypothetical protein